LVISHLSINTSKIFMEVLMSTSKERYLVSDKNHKNFMFPVSSPISTNSPAPRICETACSMNRQTGLRSCAPWAALHQPPNALYPCHMSATPKSPPVPSELALLYEFANSLDLRRFVQGGVPHVAGDGLASVEALERWMRDRRLIERGAKLT